MRQLGWNWLAVKCFKLHSSLLYCLDVLRRWSRCLSYSLLLCSLFYETICFVLPCVILFLCFSVLLGLRLSRIGKRELILVLFVRIRFALVLFSLFPLPLGVLEGIRFVIVALPGLFSYFIFIYLFFLENGTTLKAKYFIPFRVDPFSKGRANNF